jgi:DNA-binding MurR/RpiR family transcriptional regulator
MDTDTQPGLQSLSGKVRDCYADLSPTERRLADIVLEFPGEIASYSASELARIAKVSNAAVSRFVQRLGFRNYEEMRVLAREGKSSGSPLYLLGQDGDDDGIQAHLKSSSDNILDTFRHIDPAVIEEVATAIAAARQVWLVGFRNGHFLAGYLRWQFIQVRDGVRLVPARGETLGEYLAGLTRDDVVVVFGLRRRVPQIGKIVGAAGRIGARIAYIADHGMAEDTRATWLLRCSTRAPGPLDNHTAVLTLCHILAGRLIERMGAAGRKRLACIEEFHEALDEL